MSGKALTFLDHLDELRRRLLISFVAVTLGAVACYFFSDGLIRFLLRPLGTEAGPLYFFSPSEAFLLKVKVSLFAGFLAASPVVMSQLWLFMSPALYPNERKIVIPLTALTTLLFLTGSAFCFWVVMPPALHFLIGMQSDVLKPLISTGSYVSFVSGMVLAFGVAFNLPVFTLAAVSFGFVTRKQLARYRRHAVLIIFIVAAVLTPSPDIASQIFLAVPLIILFELSLAGAAFMEVMRKKRPVKVGV